MISKFIDAHVHFNTTSSEKMEMASKYDVSFLSINTNIPFFDSIETQERVILELQKKYPTQIKFVTSFDFRNWGKVNFAQNAIDQIKRGLHNGAVGVKIWKDVGFELRDPDGSFVMIDNPIFDPIFEYLVENEILLIGHQGEPRNCWLPLNEMTVKSDRDYFRQHPEYHMFLKKDYPTYEDQIKARDNMLNKYPNLKYVGLHLFSMEYNIDEVAKRLERYPNCNTDLAERIVHLQLQCREDRDSVRNFFIKYQDRIIYGTDVIDDGNLEGTELATELERLWKSHYDFFATEKVMEVPEFEGSFKGLNLPKRVVDKIFFKNAAKTYGFAL